jgi:2-phospho-L-lactate/phosphoenolpyruvate guanylyltransferase
MAPMRWSVVIPVKRLPLAKSRLDDGTRPHRAHRELALALALDTAAAALACPAVARVVAVTDDELAAARLVALGAQVVPDQPDRGLNPALDYGAGRAARFGPADGVAAVSADLAALRPGELAAALAAAAGHRRAFVADAAGSGTTLLAARPGAALDPRFGIRSRAAHRASGAVELDGDWPSLRRDIDTAADLAAAARLGLGPATAAALGQPGAGQPAHEQPGAGQPAHEQPGPGQPGAAR